MEWTPPPPASRSCQTEDCVQETANKLQIENARYEERAANTEKRAEELRAQVERLEGELARIAQAKEEPKPKEKQAPKDKPTP